MNQGKFSTSARISSILTNVNRTPIIAKHISGKAKLNPIADVQSRLPPTCMSEVCSVHKFLNECIDTVVEDGTKLNAVKDKEISHAYSNKSAWKNAQLANQACCEARKLLSSGKPPPKAVGKYSGEYWNDIRRYCREASLTKDGLLIVKADATTLSGNIRRERIVVPKPLVPALLFHMHNNMDAHPTKAQQKAQFQRMFFGLNLENHLTLLYENCYKCSIIQKIPREIITNETKTKADKPQMYFHADIIKRAQQNILTIKDHFTSFQDATFVPSEKACDLKDGLINITAAIRRPGTIHVAVDNAPGFQTLLKNNDSDLVKLGIHMVKTDELNKNANAVIDKACQELEDELKRLEPEGQKITIATLKQALLNLNAKLRRKGQMSAYEMNYARDQNTGENLHLDDTALREYQLKSRQDKNNATPQTILVGDTVRLKNKSDKHKANEIFVVTKANKESVSVQKIIHPLKRNTKIMSKVYNTRPKLLIPIHRPRLPNVDEEEKKIIETEQITRTQNQHWIPFDLKFFNDSETDDETNDNIVKVNKRTKTRKPTTIYDISEPEIEWDDSVEQIQLLEQITTSPTQEDGNLAIAIQERNLFIPPAVEKTPPSLKVKRLRRRNAMRRKRRTVILEAHRQEVDDSFTAEPEVRNAISQPSSPSQVIGNEVANFEILLNPRIPLHPDMVQLANVQHLEHVLPQTSQPRERRRSARLQAQMNDQEGSRINYQEFHRHGRRT